MDKRLYRWQLFHFVAPFTFNWDTTTVSNASHNISVKAFNSSGLIGNDSIVVVVQNGAAAPATIISPKNGANVSGTVTIVTTFSAPAVWENIYIDSDYLASSPPTTFQWNSTSVPNGIHTITAALFGSGGSALQSYPITVTVSD
jgi:chitinase